MFLIWKLLQCPFAAAGASLRVKKKENMLAMYHLLHKSACINMTPLQLLLLHLKSVGSMQNPSVKLRSGV